jgi:hypothetical protein
VVAVKHKLEYVEAVVLPVSVISHKASSDWIHVACTNYKSLPVLMLRTYDRIVGGGVFVHYGSSAMGVLQLVRGLQSYPGAPGRIRDHMDTFRYEGDIAGVDIATIAFNKA